MCCEQAEAQDAQVSSLWLARISAVLLPIQPTSSIFGNIGIANLLCKLRSGTAPHTRLTVKDHLLIRRRFGKSKAIFEFVLWKEERVWLGLDRKVDSRWNVPSCILGRLADVLMLTLGDVYVDR